LTFDAAGRARSAEKSKESSSPAAALLSIATKAVPAPPVAALGRLLLTLCV